MFDSLAIGAFVVCVTSLTVHVILRIIQLRRQQVVAENVIRNFLDGYDPDLELDAWVKVLWSYGNPPEREGGCMTAEERAMIERLTGT